MVRPFSKDEMPEDGTTGGSTATGSTTGTTSGTTAGSTSTTATTGTTATGSTAGTTDGSTTGTTSTTTGMTSGTNSGADAGGSGSGTTATTGSTGESTGGTAPTTAGATGGTPGWTPTGDIVVEGVAANGYVSGTNVNAIFTLNLKKTGTSNLDLLRMRSVKFKIGGETDSEFIQGINQPVTPDSQGNFSYAIKVRFASTRFLDNKTVALNARFYYTLSNTGGAYEDRDFAATTTNVVTYNKGLALGTQLYVNCQSNYYAWEAPPGTPNYFDWDSQRAIPTAVAQLKNMGHTTPDNPYLVRSDVYAQLNKMTAFFAFTHGEPGGIYPTFGAFGTDAYLADRMNFSQGATSDIGKAVLGNGTDWTVRKTAEPKPIPNPNMVVLHACSGFGSGPLPILKAFGLLQPNGFIETTPMDPTMVGRGIAAFNEVVDSRIHQKLNSGDPRLSDHAKLVYAKLLTGLTLGKAVADANEAYPPAHTECSFSATQQTQMNMLVRGDANARLISVYTGDNSLPTRPPEEQKPGWYPYRWYKVNP